VKAKVKWTNRRRISSFHFLYNILFGEIQLMRNALVDMPAVYWSYFLVYFINILLKQILIWEWFRYFPLQLKILNHMKVPSKDCPATAANLWLRFLSVTPWGLFKPYINSLTCDFFLEFLILISGKSVRGVKTNISQHRGSHFVFEKNTAVFGK
jgi:hypothetical protein